MMLRSQCSSVILLIDFAIVPFVPMAIHSSVPIADHNPWYPSVSTSLPFHTVQPDPSACLTPQSPCSCSPKTRSETSTVFPARSSPDASSPPANAASHSDLSTPLLDCRAESVVWALAAGGAGSCATRRSLQAQAWTRVEV